MSIAEPIPTFNTFVAETNMSPPRRLTSALLLAVSAVLPLAYAQDCNPQDQIWDSVRHSSTDLSETPLINKTAHAWPCRKPYVANLLQHQVVRETPSATVPSHVHLRLCLISFQVPLDYNKPNGTQAVVALLKVSAAVPMNDTSYRGPILFNPGRGCSYIVFQSLS